jgi:hypothetical protein
VHEADQQVIEISQPSRDSHNFLECNIKFGKPLQGCQYQCPYRANQATGYAGGTDFWQYKKSHRDSKVYENIAAAPANLQVKYIRKITILSYFAFPAMSAFTAWELKNLESGNAETVQLWFPLGLIYEHMGYWPTVLTPICFGIICVVIFRWKMTKISQELKTNNP